MAGLRSVIDIEAMIRTLGPVSKADFLREDGEVVIYGAGNAGRDVLHTLKTCGVVVRCFLDRAAYGGHIEGVPVLRPDDEALPLAARKGARVVIAIFNPVADVAAVSDELTLLGYRKIMTFVEFHGYFPDDLGARYWLVSREFYRGLASAIGKGLEVLEDDMSREIYLRTVEARLRNDHASLPRPEVQERQYFPDNVPIAAKPSRFVDCGSFEGDTLKRLHERYGTIEWIAAFEPGLENFVALSDFVGKTPSLADRIVLFPCGVWSSTVRSRFCEKGAASSIGGGDGEPVITCVALDDALRGFDPTHIKMDIEGAEYEGIMGAQETIRRSRPDLAICLYHRPEHLWQIPRLISQWDVGYKLFLRQYGHNGFDLVMYACSNRSL